MDDEKRTKVPEAASHTKLTRRDFQADDSLWPLEK